MKNLKIMLMFTQVHRVLAPFLGLSFTQGFAMILGVSEMGDKTFFMGVMLSGLYPGSIGVQVLATIAGTLAHTVSIGMSLDSDVGVPARLEIWMGLVFAVAAGKFAYEYYFGVGELDSDYGGCMLGDEIRFDYMRCKRRVAKGDKKFSSAPETSVVSTSASSSDHSYGTCGKKTRRRTRVIENPFNPFSEPVTIDDSDSECGSSNHGDASVQKSTDATRLPPGAFTNDISNPFASSGSDFGTPIARPALVDSDGEGSPGSSASCTVFEFPRHDDLEAVREDDYQEEVENVWGIGDDDSGCSEKANRDGGKWCSNHNFFNDYSGDSHDMLLKSDEASSGYLHDACSYGAALFVGVQQHVVAVFLVYWVLLFFAEFDDRSRAILSAEYSKSKAAFGGEHDSAADTFMRAGHVPTVENSVKPMNVLLIGFGVLTSTSLLGVMFGAFLLNKVVSSRGTLLCGAIVCCAMYCAMELSAYASEQIESEIDPKFREGWMPPSA